MYFFYTVFFVKSRFAHFAFCKAKCKVLKGKGNTTAARFSVHCRSWKFSFSVSQCQEKIREFDIWLRVGTLIVSVFFVCLCSCSGQSISNPVVPSIAVQASHSLLKN